jgi:CelD/BcsL family acetyltransferase involved in cellulose biosynthesis
MTVIRVNPVTDPRWQQFVDHARGSLFHSPPWGRVLSDTYGLKPQALMTIDSAGNPVAGIIYCQVSDLAGDRLVSLPFSDYCDPLLTSREEWEVLFGELRKSGLPITFRCRRCPIPLGDERLILIKKARWHGIDLSQGTEALWKNLAETSRRSIRKARRERLQLRASDDETFLQGFYRLHHTIRKHKYRLLAQPPAFFAAIRRRFQEVDGWFPLAAEHDGQLVGTTVFLRWNETLYYKFNASQSAALHLRPNDFLLWEGIVLGKSLGCSWLDLGLSDEDQPGLVRFKRHFGAQEGEIRFFRYRASGETEDREKEMLTFLREITGLVTDPSIPDEISSRAGALFYRFFA